MTTTRTTPDPDSPLKALLEASLNSPLSEADPNSLDEFMNRIRRTFNTPPIDKDENGNYLLSDEDIAANVRYFRLQGAKFALLAKEKADKDLDKKPRTKKPSTTIAPLSQSDIDSVEI